MAVAYKGMTSRDAFEDEYDDIPFSMRISGPLTVSIMDVKLRNMPKTGEREYYVTLELAGGREDSPPTRGRMGVVEFEDFMASFYVYCKYYYVQMFELAGSIGYTEHGARHDDWTTFTIELTELMDAEEGQVKIPLNDVCPGARIEFETFVVDIGDNMSSSSSDDNDCHVVKDDKEEIESSSEEEEDEDDIPNYLIAKGPLNICIINPKITGLKNAGCQEYSVEFEIGGVNESTGEVDVTDDGVADFEDFFGSLDLYCKSHHIPAFALEITITGYAGVATKFNLKETISLPDLMDYHEGTVSLPLKELSGAVLTFEVFIVDIGGADLKPAKKPKSLAKKSGSSEPSASANKAEKNEVKSGKDDSVTDDEVSDDDDYASNYLLAEGPLNVAILGPKLKGMQQSRCDEFSINFDIGGEGDTTGECDVDRNGTVDFDYYGSINVHATTNYFPALGLEIIIEGFSDGDLVLSTEHYISLPDLMDYHEGTVTVPLKEVPSASLEFEVFIVDIGGFDLKPAKRNKNKARKSTSSRPPATGLKSAKVATPTKTVRSVIGGEVVKPGHNYTIAVGPLDLRLSDLKILAEKNGCDCFSVELNIGHQSKSTKEVKVQADEKYVNFQGFSFSTIVQHSNVVSNDLEISVECMKNGNTVDIVECKMPLSKLMDYHGGIASVELRGAIRGQMEFFVFFADLGANTVFKPMPRTLASPNSSPARSTPSTRAPEVPDNGAHVEQLTKPGALRIRLRNVELAHMKSASVGDYAICFKLGEESKETEEIRGKDNVKFENWQEDFVLTADEASSSAKTLEVSVWYYKGNSLKRITISNVKVPLSTLRSSQDGSKIFREPLNGPHGGEMAFTYEIA